MVSIIIPCYNAAAWLSKTIESCLAQKEFITEIIIVDDSSQDASWQIISDYQLRYPGLIIGKKNMQKGGNNARNAGFDLSRGEYIQWLDADDQLLPGKFREQLDLFGKYEDTDIVYSDWQLDTYNQQGEKTGTEHKYHKPYKDFLFELLIDNWSPPHNYLLKRPLAATLRSLNAWNPSTPVFQDREYFTRAAIQGAKFRYAPGTFSVYNRWNKNSVSQDQEKKKTVLLNLFSAFQKQIGENDRFDDEKKAYYKRVIGTLKLSANLSLGRLTQRNKELKFRSIEWSILDYKAKLKMGIALVINIFHPNR